MCWPTSTAPAPPTDLPRRSMDDWNTCAARPSGSATSPTTSHDRSSRPADSDPTYTLDPDEPDKRLASRYRADLPVRSATAGLTQGQAGPGAGRFSAGPDQRRTGSTRVPTALRTHHTFWVRSS